MSHVVHHHAALMLYVENEIMQAHVVVCQAISAIPIQNVAPNASTIMIVRNERPVLTTNAGIHARAFAARIQSVMLQITHRTVPVCQASLAIHLLLATKFVRSHA